MSPTLTGDHENRVTDYTAIACYVAKRYADYSEGLPTLRASGGDIGGGYRRVDTFCFRKMSKPDKHGKGERWITDDVTNTLNCYEISDIYTAELIVEVYE